MNYRHIYHAGNFADIFKHIILTRIIIYLQRKATAFRILDTHSGPALYNLTSELSQKTQEWKQGIGMFLPNLPALTDQEMELLTPWLDVIKSVNEEEKLQFYPGSPLISRKLMRPQDRLSAIELHPEDFKKLKKLFANDYQTKTILLDGWLALKGHLPPKEKRGLILIDPPFEQKNEFDVIIDGLKQALRKFRHGVYAIWYPIKNYKMVNEFTKMLKSLELPETLKLEICNITPSSTPKLDGCGMIVINPPYNLADDIKKLTPLLENLLSQTVTKKISITYLKNTY
ncbi:23S rRNA (adenine(2030)-N(6))-methyltransferase RlmJ [Bartonella sp. DGB1]|uniref:23S rRNA (adenine(2030)-N(6))-methyltransferase RlmJ n=1 Tax=Bartonella sp. DGB1 TaxID=3239807 RepID=UPI003526584A